ncbi:Salicylate carboxymethyltransferase [Glycine soja]
MKVAQVLHMNGGVGNASYANNSLVQQKVICLTKPIREEAITSLYCNTVPRSLAVADLGCSSGPNTLLVVSEFIKIVEKLCRELNHKSPEYKVFLNDLPGNDFNNIFKSLDSFKEKLCDEMESGIGPCYFSGVPGSFYGRVFPNQSLHFVHSSYSLHWLSKVPEGVDNNRGNVYIGSTSPTNVARAYYEQFQRDFSLFLKCRAEELVKGGCMVLTFLGRRSDDPSSKDGGYIWELMATALNDMVLQGIIKEEQLDTFNIPQYTPSPSEVKLEVLKEGSFAINRLEVYEVNWDAFDDWNALEFESERADSLSDGGYNVAQCMRAVAEPMLVSHFGEAIIEEVFSRYQQILADRMSKEKTKFTNFSDGNGGRHLQIMVRTRGLGHALGRVVDIGLGRGDHQDSDGAPQRRRPTTSARRRLVLVIVVEDVLADSLAVPEVEPVVAGDAPMVDADAQDTSAETDAQDIGSEDDADELEGFPGGPRDPSVLREYAEHVAASERLELKLSSHGRKVHNLGMPVPTIEEMVAGIELSPLIACSVDTGDRGLISSGDEYFPSSSGGGIHHVGRRHVSSSSVDRWRIHDFQPLHSDEAVLLLVELLMVSPEVAMVETGHCGGLYAHLQWLRDVYQCRCQTQHWTAIARAYLLHLLGCTLFANKSATHVHVVHLYALHDLTLTRRYAWGAVGLVHMYDQLNDVIEECNADPDYDKVSPRACRWIATKNTVKKISIATSARGLLLSDIDRRGLCASSATSSSMCDRLHRLVLRDIASTHDCTTDIRSSRDAYTTQPSHIPQEPAPALTHADSDADEPRHVVLSVTIWLYACHSIADMLEHHLALNEVTPGTSTHEVILKCLRIARGVTEDSNVYCYFSIMFKLLDPKFIPNSFEIHRNIMNGRFFLILLSFFCLVECENVKLFSRTFSQDPIPAFKSWRESINKKVSVLFPYFYIFDSVFEEAAKFMYIFYNFHVFNNLKNIARNYRCLQEYIPYFVQFNVTNKSKRNLNMTSFTNQRVREVDDIVRDARNMRKHNRYHSLKRNYFGMTDFVDIIGFIFILLGNKILKVYKIPKISLSNFLDFARASGSVVRGSEFALIPRRNLGLIVTSLCSTLPRSLTIADFGCSFGPNTLLVVSELIKTVEKLCRELNHKSPEYKAFFNDLPGNDFNNLFMSLDIFKENLCDKMKTRIGPCYFFGAPDSFYDMLFPNRSLHFVHSSYTAFNGYLSLIINIYLHFKKISDIELNLFNEISNNFKILLKSKELEERSLLLFLIYFKKATFLSDMEFATRHRRFIICIETYIRERACDIEKKEKIFERKETRLLKLEVLKEGSFTINHIEVAEVDWNVPDGWNTLEYERSESSLSGGGFNMAKCMRSVTEPMLVFNRFQEILADSMFKEKTGFNNFVLLFYLLFPLIYLLMAYVILKTINNCDLKHNQDTTIHVVATIVEPLISSYLNLVTITLVQTFELTCIAFLHQLYTQSMKRDFEFKNLSWDFDLGCFVLVSFKFVNFNYLKLNNCYLINVTKNEQERKKKTQAPCSSPNRKSEVEIKPRKLRIMEVAKVLHMNGGVGDASYANNSFVQQKLICLTKPLREEAIKSLYCGTLPRRLAMADLGCSSGQHALIVVSDFIKTVEKLCLELNHKSPEYKVFFNDLPGNDFNNIFKSLDSFKQKLCEEMESGIGPCYFFGAPGSFYGRIFSNQSVHFIHSSYSLQWLSKVPEYIDNNKGNIYLGRTSPSNVVRAYYEQYQRDFSLFLKCRAEELVEGGRMILTIMGRRSDDPSSKDGCYIWEIMATALNDMGIIKEEQLDTFNIPFYTPSPSEVKLEVLKEGSFAINCLEVSVVHWSAWDEWSVLDFESESGYNLTQSMRAVAESMLVSHFGEAIIDELFSRYQEILADRMSKEKTKFINVTILLTRIP